MMLTEGELHPDVKIHAARFVQETGTDVNPGYSGKLSMGIGGINSCVISRPWPSDVRPDRVPEEAPSIEPART